MTALTPQQEALLAIFDSKSIEIKLDESHDWQIFANI